MNKHHSNHTEIQTYHFADLQKYHEFLGVSAPEHPLFSIITLNADSDSNSITVNDDNTVCSFENMEISTDFYSISLKNIISGDIYYGRTKYDYQNGSLICLAPRQTVQVTNVKTKSNAKVVLIHEDFIRGTSIQKVMESANYFSYAINEALHLSPKEEALLATIFDTLELEYQQNHDAFSKDIIISQLHTLLTYGERFYQRQFQQRMETPSNTLFERFMSVLKNTDTDHIPSVEEIASTLNMTSRYLSDGLKLETGKTALENIHHFQIEQAKNRLLGSSDSVATIAYDLGFEYPQYFSRLFKNKVGMTPTQYRNYKFH